MTVVFALKKLNGKQLKRTAHFDSDCLHLLKISRHMLS